MTTLPAHRRILQGRTYSQPWNPAECDPIQCYPRASSRIVTAGYAVVCLLASGLIGWLLAQGL
ncbi:MAG: hypothetical protein ACRC1H_09115 [Caldilineaceae bacterium]